MKKYLVISISAIFFSCSVNTKKDSFFQTRNIRSQHFVINPDADTVLTGLRGGVFSISKGSFEGDGPVDIEIKEVYSPVEILYAGLTTESDGRLLESGGMVYFNATRKSRQARLVKPVNISIPTHYINKEMKLFKGKEKTDGTINWVDPELLDSSANFSPIDTGKLLYEKFCTNCHSLDRDLTGPALLFVEDRVKDRAHLKEFIKNPPATVQRDRYFQCQKARFGSMMTAFPMSDRELDQILDYIKNESAARPNLQSAFAVRYPADCPDVKDSGSQNLTPPPCGFDTSYVDTTDQVFANANMMPLHQEATKEDSMDYLYKNPDSLEKVMRKGFTDNLSTNGRYNFKIKTLGWFNIDAFYEGMKGTTIVDLFVKSDFADAPKLEVHVFFPAKKILTVGTYHKNDSLFHFEKYKGQTPLFINDEAVVFGVISIKEKIYYGISRFRVSKNQTIQLNIREGSEEDLEDAFRSMKLDGVDIDIITKKRIINPKDCDPKDSINTK